MTNEPPRPLEYARPSAVKSSIHPVVRTADITGSIAILFCAVFLQDLNGGVAGINHRTVVWLGPLIFGAASTVNFLLFFRRPQKHFFALVLAILHIGVGFMVWGEANW